MHIFWEFWQPEQKVVYAIILKKLLPHLLAVDFARGLFMIYTFLNGEFYQLSNAVIRNLISRMVFQEFGKACNTRSAHIHTLPVRLT